MKSFPLIPALLLFSCSSSFVSGSEPQTVQVELGKEVTLLCSSISKAPTKMEWFRMVNRTKPSCISSMFNFNGEPSYCDGFQRRFEMSSNVSTVFLKIKEVDVSDSGLYFCGFYIKAHTVISGAMYLNVEGRKNKEEKVDFETESSQCKSCRDTCFHSFKTEESNLVTVILSGLCAFLTVVIIVLIIKIKTNKTALTEETKPQRNKNQEADDLNYAALNFQAKPKRSNRPAPNRELETNVVYAATR